MLLTQVILDTLWITSTFAGTFKYISRGFLCGLMVTPLITINYMNNYFVQFVNALLQHPPPPPPTPPFQIQGCAVNENVENKWGRFYNGLFWCVYWEIKVVHRAERCGWRMSTLRGRADTFIILANSRFRRTRLWWIVALKATSDMLSSLSKYESF